MKEGGKPLSLAFQYLILMILRPFGLKFVIISSLASKCQDFKLRCLQFHKTAVKRIPILRTCLFEASQCIITLLFQAGSDVYFVFYGYQLCYFVNVFKQRLNLS